jgi:hypothetical protein
MFVKKLTPGRITIASFVFVEGEKVPVSASLGKYISDNFGSIFEVYEEVAPKPKARPKRSKATTKSEG